MSDDDRITKLEEEMKRLKAKQQDNDDDEAVKYRSDQYRFSRIDGQMGSQEIHGNLKGLNNDDHPHYLNSTRHDVSARHGDDVIGNRTIDDTSAPTGNEGKLTNLFSWLGYMIKAITGEANWRTIPTTTLKTAGTHISAANPHSGSAPTVHNLVDTTNHPVSGLTAGHFLKATGEETYTFGPHGLTAGDVGALAKQSGSSLPAAGETYRGQFFTVEGGAGVADQVYICVKDDSDTYVWQEVSLI
jgi:hypothetical protein